MLLVADNRQPCREAIMTTAAIVQTRRDPEGLEGFDLADIGGRTALARVLDRCARIPGVDRVICAVPETEIDTSLALEILRTGHCLSVGAADDPLANMVTAVDDHGVDTVVRVPRGAVFLDPQICGRVIDLYTTSRADYASNTMPPLFPIGLECEVFPSVLLQQAHQIARSRDERCSVTGWMREHVHLKTVNLRGPGGGLEGLRWSLQSQDDLDFARQVFDHIGDRAAEIGAAELAALCLRRPDLLEEVTHSREVTNNIAALQADIETAVAPLNLAA